VLHFSSSVKNTHSICRDPYITIKLSYGIRLFDLISLRGLLLIARMGERGNGTKTHFNCVPPCFNRTELLICFGAYGLSILGIWY